MDVSSEFPMHVLHFFFCNCSITELKLAMLAFFFFFFFQLNKLFSQVRHKAHLSLNKKKLKHLSLNKQK